MLEEKEDFQKSLYTQHEIDTLSNSNSISIHYGRVSIENVGMSIISFDNLTLKLDKANGMV